MSRDPSIPDHVDPVGAGRVTGYPGMVYPIKGRLLAGQGECCHYAETEQSPPAHPAYATDCALDADHTGDCAPAPKALDGEEAPARATGNGDVGEVLEWMRGVRDSYDDGMEEVDEMAKRIAIVERLATDRDDAHRSCERAASERDKAVARVVEVATERNIARSEAATAKQRTDLAETRLKCERDASGKYLSIADAAKRERASIAADNASLRAEVDRLKGDLESCRAREQEHIQARDALHEQLSRAKARAGGDGLREALLGALKLCRCRGTGKYTRDCTLCGDSTYDHQCNDEERDCTVPVCVAARRALDAPVEGAREESPPAAKVKP